MSICTRRVRSARLVVESLESRCTPAGQVAAVLSGTTLVITGDALDNAIQVEDGSGGVLVSGLWGTLINGSPSVTFSDVGSLRIQMNQGNDVVYLGGLTYGLTIAGSLTVDLGAGDDQLTIYDTDVGGSTIIRARAGDDVVAVNGGNTFNGSVIVHLEQGQDNFATSDTNTFNRALRILGGAGSDAIFLQDNFTVNGTLEIQGGAGDENILVGNLPGNWVRKLVVNTAAGNDFVQMSDLQVQTSATVLLGVGDDELQVINSTFGSAYFDGGPHLTNDTFNDGGGNSFGSPSTIINFP